MVLQWPQVRAVSVDRVIAYCDFVKSTFVKWGTGCQMVSPVQQKTRRETEIDKFITHRSWRKYTAGLEGPLGEVKGRCRQREGERERGGGGGQVLRHMPLFGSVERVLLGSQAKASLSNSNQKEWGFGKPMKVLPKAHPRRRPWEAGKT